jgi:hypothetical protein
MGDNGGFLSGGQVLSSFLSCFLCYLDFLIQLDYGLSFKLNTFY